MLDDPAGEARRNMPVTVNDVHSHLNSTLVADVVRPGNLDELVGCIHRARQEGLRISVSGGRHSMGGQQFGTGALHIDCRGLDQLHHFDLERGLIRIGGGAQWPAMIDAIRRYPGAERWGIRQKQTGADDLTLAGAASSNVHGRGLAFGPIVDDVESLTLVTSDAQVVTCSRESERELFGLVCGGYGMFGLIADVTLRLTARQRLVRLVDICDVDEALHAVRRRAAEGCIYGDFQYAIDARDDEFLRRGVFACYKPARPGAADPDDEADLPRERWLQLLRLAHDNPREAFALYSGHYLYTHGRTYWSDTMQLATYLPSYAEILSDAADAGPTATRRTLMITELYVPPDSLPAFMAESRRVLRGTGVRDIYGTIRAIQPDRTTFLPWATGERACIIFNLLVQHEPDGIARTQDAARGLIDAAAGFGGSFYLTYHRWATRDQLLRCHPRLPGWLLQKRRYDPDGLFTSDWYEHVRGLLEPST
jgi:FAD/FMN-containing dehydrogenase